MTYKKKRPRKAGLEGGSWGGVAQGFGRIPGWWYGLSHEGWICSLVFPGHELPTVPCWAQAVFFLFSPFNTADLFLLWSVIRECVSPRNQWTREGLDVVLYLTLAFSFHPSYLKSATQLVCVNLTSQELRQCFLVDWGRFFTEVSCWDLTEAWAFWQQTFATAPPKMAFLI